MARLLVINVLLPALLLCSWALPGGALGQDAESTAGPGSVGPSDLGCGDEPALDFDFEEVEAWALTDCSPVEPSDAVLVLDEELADGPIVSLAACPEPSEVEEGTTEAEPCVGELPTEMPPPEGEAEVIQPELAPTVVAVPTTVPSATATPTPVPTHTPTGTPLPTAGATGTAGPTSMPTDTLTPTPPSTATVPPTATFTSITTATVVTPTVAPQTASVRMSDYAFSPASVTIRAGGMVTWTDQGAAPHTATRTGAGAFDTGVIGPGGSATRTFPAAGSYAYTCTLHPGQMSGTVIVQG